MSEILSDILVESVALLSMPSKLGELKLYVTLGWCNGGVSTRKVAALYGM